jgi:hypothetical protein
MNDFESRWMSIAAQGYGAGRFRVYPDHVLDFYVQYTLTGMRELMIEIRGESLPALELPNFRNIDISTASIAGGLRIGLTLKKPDFTRSFSVMCYDLAERTRDASTTDVAAGTLVAALRNWAEMFRRRENEGLTREEALGLLGELLVIDSILNETSVDPISLLQGWGGPDGDARDIGVANIRVEVKTQRTTSANRVRISSLAQLDDRGDRVFLVVLRLAPDDNGRSLVSVVEDLSARLKKHPLAELEFNRTIELSGMDPDAAMSRIAYAEDDRLVYAVTAQFPRLVPSGVPTGVVAARYEVGGPALDACRSDWKILLGALRWQS